MTLEFLRVCKEKYIQCKSMCILTWSLQRVHTQCHYYTCNTFPALWYLGISNSGLSFQSSLFLERHAMWKKKSSDLCKRVSRVGSCLKYNKPIAESNWKKKNLWPWVQILTMMYRELWFKYCNGLLFVGKIGGYNISHRLFLNQVVCCLSFFSKILY